MREDLLYKKRFVSPSCRQILGYAPEEILNKTGFLDYIHPDSMHEWLAGIVELKTKKIPTRIVFRAKRKNGSLLWAECLINPVLRDNELFEMVSVIRDITERIEYQEEIEEHARNKELLMREVHHRVKNNLSILLSLIRMHKFSITNIKISELLDDLQFRVQTMAMVHRQLQESRNIDELSIGPYLSGLVRSVMKAFDSNHVEVETYFHEEMVHVDILLPLGLIVNELLTNIFKHAFPGRTPGHIWIRYENNGDEAGCMRKLTISDDGIGFPENFDFFSTNTLGSQLVCQLTQQLNGKIEVTSKNGTSFTLTLPVRAGKNAGLIKQAQ
jgi:PAS domain S-box-containing protein